MGILRGLGGNWFMKKPEVENLVELSLLGNAEFVLFENT